jgi:hypothetical protein
VYGWRHGSVRALNAFPDHFVQSLATQGSYMNLQVREHSRLPTRFEKSRKSRGGTFDTSRSHPTNTVPLCCRRKFRAK